MNAKSNRWSTGWQISYITHMLSLKYKSGNVTIVPCCLTDNSEMPLYWIIFPYNLIPINTTLKHEHSLHSNQTMSPFSSMLSFISCCWFVGISVSTWNSHLPLFESGKLLLLLLGQLFSKVVRYYSHLGRFLKLPLPGIHFQRFSLHWSGEGTDITLLV